MAYITSKKQLIAPDLELFITSLTGFEINSPEFKKCLDIAWRHIFNHYYTRIDDQSVRQTLLNFSEKFVFHGYPQKAKNLKILVDAYENSEYFKDLSPDQKWGIIQFLIKLSYRPTDKLEDDEPIDLNVLATDGIPEEEKDDVPNWGEYLKEGWERFRLPTDESSSEESSYFSDSEPSINGRRIEHLLTSPIQLRVPEVRTTEETEWEKQLEKLRRAENHKEWLRNNTQNNWWKDPTFSENPPTKHSLDSVCSIWVSEVRRRNSFSENYRIISEHKVLRDLIWILGYPPITSTSLVIVGKNNYFTPNKRISYHSLTPPTFHRVLQSRVLKYLYFIREITAFVDKINSMSTLDDRLPYTYIAYSGALTDIINDYRGKLISLENEIRKQEKFFTVRRLLNEINSWLKLFKHLTSIHKKAIYIDFEEVDNWKCSMRLLSVLYDHLFYCSNTEKNLALGLFVKSFSAYLEIISRFLSGCVDPDSKNEFIIFKHESETLCMDARDCQQFLNEIESKSHEFWDPFVSICLRALSSAHFLFELKNFSTFSKVNVNNDVLENTFVNCLRKVLSMEVTEEEIQAERKIVKELTPFAENDFDPCFVKKPIFFREVKLFGDTFDKAFECYRTRNKPIFKKSSSKKFVEDLKNVDISVHLMHTILSREAVNTIHQHMEPPGIAVPILLGEHKLLEHLQYVRRAFFIHSTQPFALILYQKILEGKQWTHEWTDTLRNCLYESCPANVANQFSFSVGEQINIIDADNILEWLSFVTMYYEPELELKSIITKTCLIEYNLIFRFLLQLKWVYKTVKDLQFRSVVETARNTLRVRRLYSMKMWLLHTLVSLNNYFSHIDENLFEDSVTKLCQNTRDLHSIQQMHLEFIKEYKLQCFLTRNHVCKEPIRKIFLLCEELQRMWEIESENGLTDENLQEIEESYIGIIMSLAAGLQIHEWKTKKDDHNFALLFHDIMNNIPSANVC